MTDTKLPGPPRRADPRHTLRRAIELRCPHWDSYVKLYTANISRGGMLVRMPDPPDVGSTVDLVVDLPGGRRLTLQGRVARISDPPEGEKLPRVGIALEVGPLERDALVRHLAIAHSEGAGQPDASESPRAKQAATTGVSAQSASTRRLTKRADPVIGIDFGTTYCSVGMLEGDRLHLFEDEGGRTAIPSVVWFEGAGKYRFGQEARDRMTEDPTRAIPSIKRLLGCTIDDPKAVPHLLSLASPGRAGPNNSIVFDMEGEEVTPAQVAALILGNLRSLAERRLGTPVRRAVMAFPLAFGQQQRAAIETAARIAGLEVAAMIPEPMAAAAAYGRHRGGKEDELVGIYDFGGGTFDFCVLDVLRGSLEVCGAAGDPWLGGDDLDRAIGSWAADEFWKASKIDLRRRAVEWQRLLQASEEAKRYLSMVDDIEIFVPRVALSQEGPLDLSVPLTRSEMHQQTADLINNTLAVCRQALKEAELAPIDLDQILLTGGTSRIPAIGSAIRSLFGKEPHDSLHPELAVVIGTALRAAEIDGRALREGPWPSMTLQQVAGHTVGLALAGGVSETVIARSTAIPIVVRRVFSTWRDGQTELDLHVIEGESDKTVDNRTVGRFNIAGLKPGPAGSVEVEVIFEMSDAYALHITARDLRTGRRSTSMFDLGQG